MTKYIFFLLIAFNSFGQIEELGLTDTLKCERLLFKTIFTVNGQKISKEETYKIIGSNSEAGKKFFRSSKRLLPLSILSTATGLYLTISGIRGSGTGSRLINNEIKTYRIRSFTKTIIGIGLLTGAVCFLEYSDDLFKTSVNIYNKGKMSGTLGLSANGVGITLKF